jgi:hypothetical protein
MADFEQLRKDFDALKKAVGKEHSDEVAKVEGDLDELESGRQNVGGVSIMQQVEPTPDATTVASPGEPFTSKDIEDKDEKKKAKEFEEAQEKGENPSRPTPSEAESKQDESKKPRES